MTLPAPRRAAALADTLEVKAKIWDLPTRVVHWLFAVLIPFSWWSAVNDHLSWHLLSGATILGLLIFRLIWGLIGSSTARFSSFLAGPRTIAAYVSGRLGHARVGHNPLGGWSVAALLAVLSLQVCLGLFAVDEDGIEAGPLSNFVSFHTGRLITHWHQKIFWVLLALIVLHLGAILFYALRRKNLVGPMITGFSRLAPGVAAPVIAAPWRALGAAVLAGTVAWFVAHGLALALAVSS